jgi:hypothetical protein
MDVVRLHGRLVELLDVERRDRRRESALRRRVFDTSLDPILLYAR